ncbi:MAG: hypothetical protein ACPIOQ_62070, partial [Promethearchaeia archaeon]
MTARGAAESACPVMLSSGRRRGQSHCGQSGFSLKNNGGCRAIFGIGEAEMREQRRGGPAGEARRSARRSRS